jgi:hypothetical protein
VGWRGGGGGGNPGPFSAAAALHARRVALVACVATDWRRVLAMLESSACELLGPVDYSSKRWAGLGMPRPATGCCRSHREGLC